MSHVGPPLSLPAHHDMLSVVFFFAAIMGSDDNFLRFRVWVKVCNVDAKYLPCFDSDAILRVMNEDILHSDVGDAGLAVALSKPSYAASHGIQWRPWIRPTIYVPLLLPQLAFVGGKEN